VALRGSRKTKEGRARGEAREGENDRKREREGCQNHNDKNDTFLWLEAKDSVFIYFMNQAM